jgi:hypothetical protein
LKDKTKPGHRKILALFLVDPTRTIPSSSDIPDQRRETYQELLLQAPLIQKLPEELRTMIFDRLENGFSRKEAEEIRLDLMKERAVTVESMDTKEESRFAHTFNMW